MFRIHDHIHDSLVTDKPRFQVYMVFLRQRKNSKVGIEQKAESSIHSPVRMYRKLVAKSGTIFRSDIEFIEKPRQIVFGSILILILLRLSTSRIPMDDDVIIASRYALSSLLSVTVIYAMLQSKDGLMVRRYTPRMTYILDTPASDGVAGCSWRHSFLFHDVISVCGYVTT